MNVRSKKFRQLSAVVATTLAMLTAVSPSFAQQDFRSGSTVLPTDTVPLPLPQERQALGESLKLRLFQKLPARFYFSSTVESSFRTESNVFQFPTRSAILRKFAPDGLENLSLSGVQSVQGLLDRSYAEDCVFRVTPNVTAGWALTQNTNVFANYYCLRDQLFKNNVLSTTINQYALAIEHKRNIPKTRMQGELQFQARELFQSNVNGVFDYIPSITLTLPITKSYNWIAYFNGLLQLRSTKFACLPDRSITPFYTWGLAHTKGRWAFSANATMLNTYQKGFSQARSDINSGSWICDFEIARQVIDRLPGFQAFVRCEPVFNFGGRNNPGLSGNDVRVFFGMRMSAYKPSMLATINQLKQHYQGGQAEPKKQKAPKKPVNPEQQPPPPTEEGAPADPTKKKQPSDPGSVGMEDAPVDMSLITLDPNFKHGEYPPLSLKPVELAAVQDILESLEGGPQEKGLIQIPDSTPKYQTQENPSGTAEERMDQPSTQTLEPEPIETPATPMHGFLDHKADTGNRYDATTISAIPVSSETE